MARKKVEDRGACAEVRQLRESRGLTQAALASLVGVSPNYMASIERGEATGWSPDLLFSLTHALGVSAEHFRRFFAAPGSPPPPAVASELKRGRGRPPKPKVDPLPPEPAKPAGRRKPKPAAGVPAAGVPAEPAPVPAKRRESRGGS